MNLYLIERTDRVGYDEYDSIVVAAENEEEALEMGPNWPDKDYGGCWASKEKLIIELIGTTTRDRDVIITSFNAG